MSTSLSERIDTRVDEQMARRVRNEAKRLDRSEGAVVRLALRAYFDRLDTSREEA